MEKTTHYQLNKPEASDPIRVEDFNENTDKIDGALKNLTTAVESLNTAAAGFGNCKIASGTYVGTGAYGSGSPTVLNVDFPPQLVLMGYENKDGDVRCRLFVRNLNSRFDLSDSFSSSALTMAWGDTSYSMYSTNALGQMNYSGYTYYYFVLG